MKCMFFSSSSGAPKNGVELVLVGSQCSANIQSLLSSFRPCFLNLHLLPKSQPVPDMAGGVLESLAKIW